jgi:hypothetical protein
MSCRREKEKIMFRTSLITMGAMVSVVVFFSTDVDAGKRRGSGFSAAPVKMKAESRRTTVGRQFTGTSGVPADKPDAPSRANLMADFCNAAGGGASSNPDGTASCVDPDGNDVLDPTPVPD